MKNRTKLIIVLFVLAICFGIYKLATFQLFDEEFTKIEEIVVEDKDYKLEIYHIPSNASSQSYIQVRKVENDVVEVIQNYERYDELEDFSFVGSDSLTIKLKNSNLKKVESKEFTFKLP